MRVKFDHPDFPEGTAFDIGGLLLPNGLVVEISEEQAAEFEAKNNSTLTDKLSTVRYIEIDGRPSYYPSEPKSVETVESLQEDLPNTEVSE